MTIYCPKCRQVVEGGDAINGMVQCPKCSDWFPAPKSFVEPALAALSPATPNERPRLAENTPSIGSAFLAGSLIVTGIIGLVYFLLFFDTTVPCRVRITVLTTSAFCRTARTV